MLMTNGSKNIKRPPEPENRAFILCGGFFGTVISGYWLGSMIVLAVGLAPAEPPLFPGEYLVVSLIPLLLLVGFHSLIRQVDELRLTTLVFLAVAAFSILNALSSLYLLTPVDTVCIPRSPEAGPSAAYRTTLVAFQESLPPQCRPSPPATSSPIFWASLAPSALFAAALCLSVVRRSTRLRLAGLAVGAISALSVLLLALARTFG